MDHVDRMNTDRIASTIKDGKSGGRRLVERPPKRWKDSWASTYRENDKN